MPKPRPDWLQNATQTPVFRGQAGEDSLQDLDAIRSLGRPARVLVVGASCCTAAALASLEQVVEIELVDPADGQLALTRLLLQLLLRTPPAARLALLGHAPGLTMRQRRERLTGLLTELDLPEDALGSLDDAARRGPAYAGRLELASAALREALSPCYSELQAFLNLRDLPEQESRIAAGTVLGDALDAALGQVFGPEPAESLGSDPGLPRGLLKGIRDVAARLPTAGNPYLWQLLAGRYPAETSTPWLSAPVRDPLPKVSWSVADPAARLSVGERGFDGIHLGHTLDGLDAEAGLALLSQAADRLLPGGVLLTRQLTSRWAPAASGALTWDVDYAERLMQQDRSPWSGQLHVGRKP